MGNKQTKNSITIRNKKTGEKIVINNEIIKRFEIFTGLQYKKEYGVVPKDLMEIGKEWNPIVIINNANNTYPIKIELRQGRDENLYTTYTLESIKKEVVETAIGSNYRPLLFDPKEFDDAIENLSNMPDAKLWGIVNSYDVARITYRNCTYFIRKLNDKSSGKCDGYIFSINRRQCTDIVVKRIFSTYLEVKIEIIN